MHTAKPVPLGILRVLALDEEPGVRSTVASKRKLDDALFGQLMADEDGGVRLAVALNESAPLTVLEVLAADEWGRMAEVAKSKLQQRMSGG